MSVRPKLLHRMALVSFLLFRKNLGNLREFFWHMVYRPPWQKIARTPMTPYVYRTHCLPNIFYVLSSRKYNLDVD